MVYQNKLVAAVKVGGQVLREERDVVALPFGSEYSILLKNLNSVRVQVKVSIDGKDATEGTWLIIHPNSDLELERFIRGGNLNRGNRFKFIERSSAVEKHRGIQVDDGLIRVEYKTEKKPPKVERIERHYHDYYDGWYPYWPGRPYYPRPWGYYSYGTWSSSGIYEQNATNSVQSSLSGQFQQSSQNVGILRCANLNLTNDAGITVAGGESNQQFHAAADFSTHEQTEVLVLKLRGVVAGKKVAKAVTVKTKNGCPTCGKKSKSNVQFCGQCGTSLQIV